MQPYWTSKDGRHVLYNADCLDVLPTLTGVDAVVTDPPYGIAYRSGHDGCVARSIQGDDSVELRDAAIALGHPSAVFATWRCVPPTRPRGCLIWEKNAGGMGDLDFPWQPNFEIVWVFGHGWRGYRGSSVLRASTVCTWNTGPAARVHPHQKPVDLLEQIITKAPGSTILDPFAGSGTTGVACIRTGRRFIGIEISREYCDIAVKRMERELSQPRLPGMEPERITQLSLLEAG